ncbi:MAG: histidinol-phosphatase HisJ family protein [Syntrophomonadaceae bacterium]|nr:histidinol-phosphatase HisJ family protein [Syntrophomonadaceae bacterium]
MLVDYHVHAVAHGEYGYSQDWANQFLDSASRRGIQEIGFSEHDEFIHLVDFNTFQVVQNARRHNIEIKLGIEMDYIPGQEQTINEIIRQKPYDYIIGSVHYIDGWGFDHPDFQGGFDERDIDDIYGQYAHILMQMVQSGCFDVVGHIDLVKIWGHRPRRRSSLDYLDPVLEAVRKSNMAVEINSAGLRKKVAELYPEEALVNRMFSYDIPITFGSDAHHPDQIGEGLAEAYQSARKAGYRYLVRFNQHNKITTAL